MHTPLPSNPLRVTLIQNDAVSDLQANMAWIEEHLPATGSTDLVALPEVFAFRGDDDEYRSHAEPSDGALAKRLAASAARMQSWLLAGSIIERAGDNACFNTSLLFDRSGRLVATYRKMHLFEAHLEGGRVIRESDVYNPGTTPALVSIEGWVCGLSICYDLRFPELYRHYAAQSANVLLIPSNFTQRTGRDHWEVLLRARAIENQSFVIAPDQCGRNPRTQCKSHGHSMAVGPWGEVLASAEDKPAVLQVTLMPAMLQETRARVPALAHRRM